MFIDILYIYLEFKLKANMAVSVLKQNGNTNVIELPRLLVLEGKQFS